LVTVVPMPKLGAGVYREGVILKWAKKEGDPIAEKEPLAEIETEKAVMTYESPTTGTVLKLLAAEGDTVLVGTPICLVGQAGEPIPAEFSPGGGEVTPSASAAGAAEVPPQPAQAGAAEISPAAKRLAENLRVNLSKVVGTGPGGSIMREDVLKAAKGQPSAQMQAPLAAVVASQPKLVPLTTMRATIAERLSKSQRETAHVTLTREVQVASVVELVKTSGAQAGFSYNDVFVKAAAEALKQHPMMNSQLEGDKIRIMDSINIGVAVAVEGGLITPTIRDADRLTLLEAAKTIRQLSEKARLRQLKSDEYSGGTFTLTNLGSFGIEAFTPIINPPQTGILGIGRVMERPWVESGEITVRPTVHFSLTFDHRVVDGADAARFLETFVGLLRDLAWLQKL
jgi:pyruvate dehydrogenase E2 component (dihydrolipoamide acetyltransferase)